MTNEVRRVLTANQLVALNLAQLRRQWGLTQTQFCAALEPYVAKRWSPAVLSAAERSVDGKRVREFTADELIAIARFFRKPVAYLLSPPDETVRIATPDRPGGLATDDVAMLTEVADEDFARQARWGMRVIMEELGALRRFMESLAGERPAAGSEVHGIFDRAVGAALEEAEHDGETPPPRHFLP